MPSLKPSKPPQDQRHVAKNANTRKNDRGEQIQEFSDLHIQTIRTQYLKEITQEISVTHLNIGAIGVHAEGKILLGV